MAPPAPVFTDAVEPDVVDPVYVPYSEESVKNCHGKKQSFIVFVFFFKFGKICSVFEICDAKKVSHSDNSQILISLFCKLTKKA